RLAPADGWRADSNRTLRNKEVCGRAIARNCDRSIAAVPPRSCAPNHKCRRNRSKAQNSASFDKLPLRDLCGMESRLQPAAPTTWHKTVGFMGHYTFNALPAEAGTPHPTGFALNS